MAQRYGDHYIQQEKQSIVQLKEQREKLEVLKIEFLKKDNLIVELQTHNEQLQSECEQLREVYQEQIQNYEKELCRSHTLQTENENLIEQLMELQRQVQDSQDMNSLAQKSEQCQQQMILLAEENARLKTEIAKLDELLFAAEPLKQENELLKEKLLVYKNEKKKFEKELKSSKKEINKQIEDFQAMIVQDLQKEIRDLQEYKENYLFMKSKFQEMERRCMDLQDENDELKHELKNFFEKEESDIKIKSELDRVIVIILKVRQDLMSVREQETQRLQDIVNGMITTSLVNSRELYNN